MKRSFIIIWVGILLFALGCEKDRKIIPRDDMVSVLVKVHLMDGAMQISQYNPDVTVPDSLDVYEMVLEDYGYTRAQFDSSLQYYSRNLRKFDRIYQQVLGRLNKMETAAQEEEGPEQSAKQPAKPSESSEKKPPGKQ